METYHIEATVGQDGTLILRDLPFPSGDRVEVTVRSCGPAESQIDPYPLRGQPIRYDQPLEPVAEVDWEILK